MYVQNGTGKLKSVLLSKPQYLQAAKINEIAKKWDEKLDIDKMMKEHQQLVKVYEDNGIEVHYLDADIERPNSVFARDFGGCIKEGYILGNFKLPLRYKEHTDYEKRMEELGIPKIAEIEEGWFEGGDFMFIDEHTIALGMADRTNLQGYEEMKKQLSPLGYTVIGVELNPAYLHLDMCFNLVDDHLAVAYEEGLPTSFRKFLKERKIEIISVSEEAIFEHGCNLQAIGDHSVISLKRNKRVNDLLREKGMKVFEIDVTEILKAGGGPHCMTFPLKRSK